VAKIVLALMGSLGDLHPALALGLELRRHGHRVAIATSEYYRVKIEAVPFEFHPLRPELLMNNGPWIRSFLNKNGPRFLLRDVLLAAVRETYADLAVAAEGADLLIASELIYPAPVLAERSGLRWISYTLAPTSLFSFVDPPLLPGPPGTHWLQSLGPGANRWLRRVAGVASWGWWKPLRRMRAEFGLPPGPNPLFEGKASPLLDLALFSSVLQSPQTDWPESTVQCGFPFYEEGDGQRQLPDSVRQFLARGEAPIGFTLGSSAVHAADDFYLESARAAEKLGRRAILLMGNNSPPPNLPPSMLAWDYLPFAQIFPRAALIVHQGGAGTTAQALRAGRPMLIVPFAFDQEDHAARMVRLGVARTLSRRNFRADRVASELKWLLNDADCTRACAEAAAKVKAERGVALAAELIERALAVR